ncbi:MAG: small conductance mechanosensitive channel [Arenicella sp.]|jgi:small conductance mechanosensitive channel
MEEYISQIKVMLVEYAPKFILAIIILLVGLKIIGAVTNFARKTMSKRNVDSTLAPFLTSLIGWVLKAMLLISVAERIGIETTSFIAVLGAASLAIGFALQGTLANFASGVLILIFRPYKIGDLVEVSDTLGVVEEIQIFTTILASLENKKVIIGNSAITSGKITNYTANGSIRVDLTIGISYGADIKKAKNVLLEIMNKHDKILKDPAPFVGVAELADSSVNLAVRPYCDPAHYWDVYFDIYEQGKIALDDNNIEIPFPQMDVHMDKLGA